MYKGDFQYLENINEYRLSVVLMTDSFFYGIFDTNHCLVSHRSFTNVRFSSHSSIEQILMDEILKLNFLVKKIAIHTEQNYQLPDRDDEFLALLPGLEFKSKKMEKLPGNRIYNYFGITKHQESLLDSLFEKNSYKLNGMPSLFCGYHLGDFDDFLHVHIDTSVILLYIQKNSKMVFYNSFKFNGSNDILYFILAVCRYSGLDPMTCKIVLSGWIERDSILFRHLAGYLGNLNIINDSQFKLSHKCNPECKKYHYFLHFMNNLCAL